MINLNKNTFSKTNLTILGVLYSGMIIFFYYIGFEHSLNDFFNAIKIATVIFLIPTIIVTFMVKWLFEIILTFLNWRTNK